MLPSRIAAAGLAPVTRARPVGGVAIDFRPQFNQIDEDVCLPAQIVGDDRRLTRNRGDDGDTHAMTLHCFDEGTKISVAGEQYHLVDISGEFHRIDRELDLQTAFDPAAAASVDQIPGLAW